MPSLSVVVPVYNIGYLTKTCMDTLINQSYKDLEIIIVNDGSTDDSKEYIDIYSKIDNVRVINLSNNQGLGNARNIGIANSTGEYLTFIDSDDWVDLDLYTELMKSIEETNADIAICGIKNEYTNCFLSESRYNYRYSNYIDSDMAVKLLSSYGNNNYRISPVVWNKIYRASIIKENNLAFLNNSYWEDDIFSFQVLLHSKGVILVPSVSYHYYHREGSITNAFSKKHIYDLINSFIYLKNYLKELSLWDNYHRFFKAYIDRTITSMINMLFQNET